MGRSPSPSSSSKRRRYDDERPSSRPPSDRSEYDRHRSSRDHDSHYRERDHHRSDRQSSSSYNSSRYESRRDHQDDHRSPPSTRTQPSSSSRTYDDHYQRRDRHHDDRRESHNRNDQRTHSTHSSDARSHPPSDLARLPPRPSTTPNAPPPAQPSPAATPSDSAKSAEEAEKQRIKREKLEAWKAKKAKDSAAAATPPLASTPQPASPAKPPSTLSHSLPTRPTSTPALDPVQAALAAAAAVSSRLGGGPPPMSFAGTKLAPSLPAKPAFSFAGSAKPSGLKAAVSLGEDVEEKKIGMIKFDDAADVDMDVGAVADIESDDEDLDGDVAFKPKGEAKRDPRAAAFLGEEGKDGEEAMAVDAPAAAAEDEEEDELDAYMSQVTAQAKAVDQEDMVKLGKKAAAALNGQEDDEDDDDKPVSEDEVEKVALTAQDILALAAKKARKGRELHAVDHSKVSYEPFRKAFYHPPREIEELTPEEVEELRLEMDDIKVRGVDPPKPAAKWSYCGLPSTCIDVIRSLEYAAPTAIQSQAIPAIMSGRDIIGVAKTGSGKTMAFILPMFRHIKDQRPLRTMEGPIAMVMTPTRELATQIYKECKPFLKALGLRASCAYGGTPLKDNIAEMKRGSEVIVCTPGRMIELLTTNSGRIINLQRITYLVLDEADRMFDMGFEPQVMKIINQIRPDRQTVLFSATFPRQMEALARKILRKPLEITVGGRSVVAAEIEQIVEVREEDTKFNRLLELLGQLFNDDNDARALIFVERQESADKLLTDLLRKNYSCMSLHGGMEQVDRDQTIVDFKMGIVPVVIATSVAARGLDVKQLKLVVQYDAPNHMEDYVHRAGRTGRAGNKGMCVTFLTKEQDRYALDIFKALVASNAKVADDVRALAEGFAEKVKAGKASGAGSGFGGKGLERLDEGRDALSRAERAAYGEPEGGDKKEEGGTAEEKTEAIDKVQEMEVEIKRGPAPDTSKPIGSRGGIAAPAPSKLDEAGTAAAGKAAEEAAEAAALAAGKTAAAAKAAAMIAKFNAIAKARKELMHHGGGGGGGGGADLSTDSARRRDPDATDFHAIVYINDYPQKARWKVTNKDTMSQLVETTGASITNKGLYYEPGKEPGAGELPKLHLLIESNEENKVQHAISEIKRALIEGATLALEAEQRNPGHTNPTGRYQIA